MLVDMGVRVVEYAALYHAAAFLREENLLLIRPGATQEQIARAVEGALLDQVPAPHCPPAPETRR